MLSRVTQTLESRENAQFFDTDYLPASSCILRRLSISLHQDRLLKGKDNMIV